MFTPPTIWATPFPALSSIPSDGTIQPTQASPYPTGANPRAVISVPHGNHATVNAPVIAGCSGHVATLTIRIQKSQPSKAGLFALSCKAATRPSSKKAESCQPPLNPVSLVSSAESSFPGPIPYSNCSLLLHYCRSPSATRAASLCRLLNEIQRANRKRNQQRRS